MQQIVVCEGTESVKVELKNPWGEFPTDPKKIRQLAKTFGALASAEEVLDGRFQRSYEDAKRRSRNDSLRTR